MTFDKPTPFDTLKHLDNPEVIRAYVEEVQRVMREQGAEIEKLEAQLQAALEHVEDLRRERDLARAGCARLRRDIEGRNT